MSLVSYAPTMGNILGDAWDYVKKEPLVLVPPMWVAQKTLQAVPTIARTARSEVGETVAAFRPPQTAPVDALTSAQTLGSGRATGGEPGSSSSLPIIVGAVVAAGLLLLAFGRKKK